MSTASIIVAIVILLGLLVSYAFVQQTVQTKREQRVRLISALKNRSRSFKFMLKGFPEGFLSKELKILVQRSLADVSEQLSALEPKQSGHLQDMQVVNAQMIETQRQAPTQQAPALETPQQIKDVRASLEELHKYVYKLETKQSIPHNQAQIFRHQIKNLALQVAVDGHSINGNNARQSGKIKLAIHYFELAFNLIARDANAGALSKRLDRLRTLIAQLKEQLAEDEQLDIPVRSSDDNDQSEEVQEEWDKFAEPSDVWKKKNIYD